jgi:hypothetical protein
MLGDLSLPCMCLNLHEKSGRLHSHIRLRQNVVISYLQNINIHNATLISGKKGN